MIHEKHGVVVTCQQSWSDFGIEKVAYEIRWLTEPGWLTLEVEEPTLCMVTTEVGGRCELKVRADQLVEGDYFGPGALTFAARGSRVTIYSAEMRQARVCCFALHAGDADYLCPEDVTVVGCVRSRPMFRNRRIETCAALLDRDRMRGRANMPYVLALSKALFAVVLEMGDGAHERARSAALTGARWSAIAKYIRDHLEKPITVEVLAGIAQVPPGRFGVAFREATGMSLRQWHMDQRVRSAQRLLADNPNESLAEVAALCGFADQSHFSRAFLKVVGLTPTVWLHRRT
jgi:AraC family transcriptional regulator